MDDNIHFNDYISFKNEKIPNQELICPKCKNNMLTFFHETFILNFAIKVAKEGKKAKQYKYINDEIFSFENGNWKKEKYFHAPYFVCNCGFHSEPKTFIKVDNRMKSKNENIDELKKLIEEKDNEIKKLKKQLNENNRNIELINSLKQSLYSKNITINQLNIEISKNKENIINLQNNLVKIENELNKIKQENYNLKTFPKGFNDKINFNSNNNIYNQKIYITFLSSDNKIFYQIPCSSDEVIAEIEEKLYKKYPEYRETNNLLLYNGNEIRRFKTIKENYIYAQSTILLIKP